MSKLNGKWIWVIFACLLLIVGFVAYRLTRSSVSAPSDAPTATAKAWFSALSAGDANSIRELGGSDKPEIYQSYKELQVVSLGTPFRKPPYPGWYVPYEIRLQSGEIVKFNLAVRNDYPDGKWRFDGGL